MDFPRMLLWTCPKAGCRKTFSQQVGANGHAILLCNQCGYTAQVQFSPAPPAEAVTNNPNDPDFQPF